jgi:tetratricopeptide (TPR) repeat protein
MTSLLILGRVSEFNSEIETFTALAEKLKQPQAVWYTALLRATRSQMRGDYRSAKVWSKKFLDQGNIALDRNAIHSYVLHLVVTKSDVGGIEDLEDAVKAMVQWFPRVVGWRAGFVLFLTELGRVQEAQELQERLSRDGALLSPQRNEWFATMAGLALSSHLISDRRIVEDLYRRLLPHSQHFVVIGYCSLFWGSAQHLLGILATTLRQWEKAESHFRSALSMNSRVGARACLARAQYDYARMLLLHGGRDREAEELLESCVGLATKLGMRRLVKKIHFLRAGD